MVGPARREGSIQFFDPRVLIRGLLLFWAIWFSIVLASNAADGLRESGLLSTDWPFVSGNFSLLAESVAIYSLPRAFAALLFSLVLVLQLAAASLFWRAALEPEPFSQHARFEILSPFIAGAFLFCGFLVFDEALLVYRRFPALETTHFVILLALLLTLLLVQAFDGRKH